MNFKSVYVSGLLAVWPVMQGMAQSELIKFGDFDQWIVRNIKESGIIGGDTKQLYRKSVRTRCGTRTRLIRIREVRRGQRRM